MVGFFFLMNLLKPYYKVLSDGVMAVGMVAPIITVWLVKVTVTLAQKKVAFESEVR